MKLLLLICIVISSFCVFSQSRMKNPGYLGRRLLLEVGVPMSFSNANLAFNYPIFSKPAFPQRVSNFHFGYAPEVSVGYFVSNNILVGLNVWYTRHKFVYNDFEAKDLFFLESSVSVVSDYTNNAYTPFEMDIGRFYVNEPDQKMNVFGADLFVEFFLGRKMIPFKVGNRFYFGGLFSKLSGKEVTGWIRNEHSIGSYLVAIPNNYNLRWKIGYSMTRRFPLKKGFFVKAAISFNYVLFKDVPTSQARTFSFFYHHGVDFHERQFLNKMLLFNINLGIGKI